MWMPNQLWGIAVKHGFKENKDKKILTDDICPLSGTGDVEGQNEAWRHKKDSN